MNLLFISDQNIYKNKFDCLDSLLECSKQAETTQHGLKIAENRVILLCIFTLFYVWFLEFTNSCYKS